MKKLSFHQMMIQENKQTIVCFPKDNDFIMQKNKEKPFCINYNTKNKKKVKDLFEIVIRVLKIQKVLQNTQSSQFQKETVKKCNRNVSNCIKTKNKRHFVKPN